MLSIVYKFEAVCQSDEGTGGKIEGARHARKKCLPAGIGSF